MIRDTSGQDRVLPTNSTPFYRRSVALWLVATALLLITAYFTLMPSSRSVRVDRLRLATVERGTLIRDASVNGRIVAAASPTLYAPAVSTVDLRIRAGDKVKRGDVLAVLESPELNNLLKREQASYDQLEIEILRQRNLSEKQKLLAQRDAEQAGIELTAAERLLQRRELGFKAGAVAEVDVLNARDLLHSAQVRSRQAAQSAELEIRNVDLELRTRTTQLERQRLLLADAKRRVQDLVLRSPVDGMVGTLAVANRSVVSLNTPLMTVVDLSQLEVEIEVPESYADDLGLGMKADITIGGAVVPGILSAISPEVVKSQVLVRVRFEQQQPEGLRQNQRISARILIEEKANVLRVERGPFVEHDGGQYAYRVHNGMAERVAISLGASSINYVEIKQGLIEGEQIVIAGTDVFLHEASIQLIQ